MGSNSRSTIICVDDEKMLLNILAEQLTEWLGSNYTIEKALSGEEALAIIDECQSMNVDVSVVISDYIMPIMKGDELLERVKLKDGRIRKIMLTGYSSLDGIVHAINKAGLYRYITKPWDNRDLMLTVIEAIKSYEQEKKASDLSKGFETLYHRYENLYIDLQKSYNQIIQSLTSAIDIREPSMAGHAQRVARCATSIGRAYNMSEEDLKFLEYSATLHDIGKLGMNDEFLQEMAGIQLYGEKAYVQKQNEITEVIVANMNDSERILKSIKYHWEKYDGSGVYGLKGAEIPMEAQIIGIANYFDLMRSNIAMGQNVPPEASAKILERTKNTVFDPNLVDVFIKLLLSNEV